MTLPSWWSDWAVWRICGGSRPAAVPPTVPKENFAILACCIEWVRWRLNGGLRPKCAPAKVDPEWWQVISKPCVRAKYHEAQPPSKPPDQQPPHVDPPSRYKNAPWTDKFVCTSHGMREVDRVWSPEQLIQRCLQYGVKSIGTQIGADCPDPDWAMHTRQLYIIGQAKGIPVWSWGRADYAPWLQVKKDIRSVMPLAGFSADVEQRCQDQQLPEHLRDEFADEMPLSVVATGGIDQSLDEDSVQAVAARWGDYFDFIGQDYHKEDLPLTPDGGENFVYWRSTAKVAHGFRHLPDANNRWHIPMGMSNAEGTPPMKDQVNLFKPYSPHIGWWDAEIIEANGEWPVFASI